MAATTGPCREVRVRSSLDGSEEPCLVWTAPASGPRPLLIGLHTWSYDRFNQQDALLPLARRHGWHLALPELRGPNTEENPRASQACASPLALQDAVDAFEHVCTLAPVDRLRVLVAGASGGGHAAMMLAAYRPELWRTVAAFCGIADLAAWHRECGPGSGYARAMEACCGGPPTGEAREEYTRRSPIHHAASAARARLTIFHGKWDRSVPFTHAVRMFDAVNAIDPQSRVFLRVFDGGHEMPLAMLEAHLAGAMHEANGASPPPAGEG